MATTLTKEKKSGASSPVTLRTPTTNLRPDKRTLKPPSTHPIPLKTNQTKPTQSSLTNQNVPNRLRSNGTGSSRVVSHQPALRYVVKRNGNEDHQNHNATKKPSLSTRSSTSEKPPSESKAVKPSPASFRERKPINPPRVLISKTPTTSRKPISVKPTTKTVYKVVKSHSSPVSTSKIISKPENTLSHDHEKMESEKSPEQESEDKEETILMNDVEEELVKVESGAELFPPENSDLQKTHQNDEEPIKSGEIATSDNQTRDVGEKIEHAEEEIKQNEEESENNIPVEVTVTEQVMSKSEEREKVNVVRSQVMNKKKNNSPAYNDVIEETASKLLEKRKNKVKALVGAFETVISLEDPQA